jgi:two-component system chemotaxis response regulator CheY
MPGDAQSVRRNKGSAAKNIMIVDDEETIRQLIVLILKTEGHTVVEAVHGRDALDKMTGETFDMVITDLRMPQMDGIMLARELRSRPHSFSIPIVMLTTGFDGYKKNEADRAGVNDRIKKPLIHQQLVDTVRRYAV